LRDFQTLNSLQAYVLVHQDARTLQVFRRDERGQWSERAEVYGAGDRVSIPTLTAPVSVDELYQDILDESGRSLLR
jgi:hypothetical protein